MSTFLLVPIHFSSRKFVYFLYVSFSSSLCATNLSSIIFNLAFLFSFLSGHFVFTLFHLVPSSYYASLASPLYASLSSPPYASLFSPFYASFSSPLYASLSSPLYASFSSPLYASLSSSIYASLSSPLYVSSSFYLLFYTFFPLIHICKRGALSR
jgi:hypothetical protein